MNAKEIEHLLDLMLDPGHVERRVGSDGLWEYRLTPKGQREKLEVSGEDVALRKAIA
jgi:hypothetical protein